jgi:calcineurin-like phosphoesterase family protein
MKTYFTADPHFDHENVIGMSDRPFASIEEHNDIILDNINRFVMFQDRLFVLGDFAWRGAASFLNRIRCKNIHLILGNHDKASVGKLFKSVELGAEVKIGEGDGKHKVWLSHYPHAYWPASHYGSFHLYGHVHAEREETLDLCFPGRRSMDVGVDNAMLRLGQYRPFCEDEIIWCLGRQPGHDPVSFYRDRQERRRITREEQQRIHKASADIFDGSLGT